jgi:hypothetical protein
MFIETRNRVICVQNECIACGRHFVIQHSFVLSPIGGAVRICLQLYSFISTNDSFKTYIVVGFSLSVWKQWE